jgi:hypothetical protein
MSQQLYIKEVMYRYKCTTLQKLCIDGLKKISGLKYTTGIRVNICVYAYVSYVSLYICIHLCSDLCITCEVKGISVTYSEYEDLRGFLFLLKPKFMKSHFIKFLDFG